VVVPVLAGGGERERPGRRRQLVVAVPQAGMQGDERADRAGHGAVGLVATSRRGADARGIAQAQHAVRVADLHHVALAGACDVGAHADGVAAAAMPRLLGLAERQLARLGRRRPDGEQRGRAAGDPPSSPAHPHHDLERPAPPGVARVHANYDARVKIYLGGPMFDLPNVRFNAWLAERLRAEGFEVYSPNENEAINDKSRTDITPEAVYRADVEELLTCAVFLCQVSEDSGTMWEAGFMDCLSSRVDPDRYRGVIGLATDIRLRTLPDPAKTGVDNQAWAVNAFIAGGLKSSLGVFGDVDALIARLREVAAS
jgi:hypothetical protein